MVLSQKKIKQDVQSKKHKPVESFFAMRMEPGLMESIERIAKKLEVSKSECVRYVLTEFVKGWEK